jgi:hypothetical protein
LEETTALATILVTENVMPINVAQLLGSTKRDPSPAQLVLSGVILPSPRIEINFLNNQRFNEFIFMVLQNNIFQTNFRCVKFFV